MAMSMVVLGVVLVSGVPAAEVAVPGGECISLEQFVVPSTRSFTDVALLPTRLTAYNVHDDAARATYTCCRPDQEEQIKKALRANAAFLDAYKFSDWADDTLMHNARVNSVKKSFRDEIQAYQQLLRYYPGSDLADDAAWGLARMHVKDGAEKAAVASLSLLVSQWPLSTWADDGYLSLSQCLEKLEDEQGAIAALDTLSRRYPHSDHCADAALKLGQKYSERGNYPGAIDSYEFVLRRYPFSDLADDAQFGIATCLRSMQQDGPALGAYQYLINRMPGSALVPRAMREVNTIIERQQKAKTVSHNARRAPKYDLARQNSHDVAERLCETGNHHMNYREYAKAIQTYRRLVAQYPGIDCYDDALYNIGVAYQQMNIVFQEINQAKGPDDLFRLSGDFKDATGRGSIPTGKQLNAINDCVSAFGLVASRLVGSKWRDDAVYQIAKSYEDVGKLDMMAYTYQQLLIGFPGSAYEMESLYEVLGFYADPKNYDKSMKMFPQLAKAAPGIFPSMMAESRDDFLHIMGAYSRHLNFAWSEYHLHHIPYRVTMPDLVPKAKLYTGAMYLERGKTAEAIKELKRVADVSTCNECGAATYVLACAYERAGQTDKAIELYTDMESRFALSGLADDARLALDRLNGAGFDIPAAAAAMELSAEGYDVHVGEHAVIFAPFTVAAKMREYNLPNIWDAAQASLERWTGSESPEKAVIVVSKSRGVRGPITIPAAAMKDPPGWGSSFAQMARRMIDSTECRMFSSRMPAVTEGLALFAASSLEYSLVSETRDTIGSAAATVLPHQAVIDQRDRSLRALEQYVRESPSPEKLTPDIVCGMLYTLLDRHGHGKYALIDWEPYTRFFEAVKEHPRANDCQTVFVIAINESFGADHSADFEQWGFRLNKAAIDRMAQL
jgi:TolA-binding protein